MFQLARVNTQCVLLSPILVFNKLLQKQINGVSIRLLVFRRVYPSMELTAY